MSDIPLREFIESELRLVRAAIEHEQELRERSEEAAGMALEKQAVEYERRLESLNHAHQRQINDKATFLSRETYEIFKKEFDAWKLELTRSIALENGRRDAVSRTWAFVSSLLSATLASLITAVVMAFLIRR